MGAACAALVSGCYAEIGAGAYGAVQGPDPIPAYSLGGSLGFYIDPGPVRVQLGGGGDVLVADDQGPADSMHVAGGGVARVDVSVADLAEPWDPLRPQLRVGAAFAGPGRAIYRDDEASEYQDLDPSFAWSGWLGGVVAIFLGDLSLSFGLGPAVIVSESPRYGVMPAWGSQLRITATWIPSGFGALFRSGYDAEEAAEALRESQIENAREGQRLQERRMEDERSYRRHRCLGGDRSSCD